MSSCYAKTTYVLSQPKMAQKIKKIKNQFGVILKERIDLNAIRNIQPVGSSVQPKERMEISISKNIDERRVFGRSEVKHKIIFEVLEAGPHEGVSIVWGGDARGAIISKLFEWETSAMKKNGKLLALILNLPPPILNATR